MNDRDEQCHRAHVLERTRVEARERTREGGDERCGVAVALDTGVQLKQRAHVRADARAPRMHVRRGGAALLPA